MKAISVLAAVVMAFCVLGCESDGDSDGSGGDGVNCLISLEDGSPYLCNYGPSLAEYPCEATGTDTATVVDSCPDGAIGTCDITSPAGGVGVVYYSGDAVSLQSDCENLGGSWE